jgi:hypothetical protein
LEFSVLLFRWRQFFSVAGAYRLYFRVFPLDVGAKRALPLPIVKVNNTRLDENMTYLVKSEATAIVDVSDAINFVQAVRSQSDQQRQATGEIVSASGALVADRQRVPQILDKNCSGGVTVSRPQVTHKLLLSLHGPSRRLQV